MFQIVDSATGIQVSPRLTFAEMLKECRVRTTDLAATTKDSYMVINVETGKSEGNCFFWIACNG